MKKLVSLLLALMVVLSLAIPAFAASDEAVITVKGKNDFSYDVDSSYHETDLFGGFKNVMPGDTPASNPDLVQPITIRNRSWATDYIKVYLKAEPHVDGKNDPKYDRDVAAAEGKDHVSLAEMEKLLKLMTLTIYDKTGKEVYSGPAYNAPDKSIYLGSLRRLKNLTFTAELSVSPEMGNEFANRIGEIDWIFTVSYHNDPSDSPKTGDFIIPIALILLISSAIALLLLVISRRRKKKN